MKVWDEQGVQDMEKMAAELIEKATTKQEVTVRVSKGTGRKNGWWERECEQMKKEVVNTLREWRRNKSDRSRFLEAKRRYRETCREKKKQMRERKRNK
jgi:hypothetical protein